MADTDTTLVTFLLDRSGSMGDIWDETIGGFNAYLETLQQGGKAIKFTLLQFDTGGIDKCCVAEPVANVKRLDRDSYQPRGGTPLIDAAFKTITAVAESLSKYDTTPSVIICIQTDGLENSSREHSWEELKRLVTEKIEKGWQFNFMGTGIDAYDQGARMGIASANTMSTGTGPAEVNASFRAAAASTMRFASKVAPTTAYLMSERHAAGDRFADKYDLTSGAPSSEAQSLDLSKQAAPTKRGAPAKPAAPTNRGTPTKQGTPSKRQVVGDFSL
jgi:uncharacterized protein YegL